jgi:hypothetical protein
MGLARTEIVRELEDKVPCPFCGSYWMDPVILGHHDWLISAIGLRASDPTSEDDGYAAEQVGCHSCGRDAAIDVTAMVRALDDLGPDDGVALRTLVRFKRQLMGSLLQGEAVTTPFGLFFVPAWAPRLVPAPYGDGFLQVSARRSPQFLPRQAFIRAVAPQGVSEQQIRACMESDKAGGFWDVERRDFCDVATGLTIPAPVRVLDPPGLFDDVVRDLRAKRSSPLRGLGAWVIRRVGRAGAPRDLVEFSFWRGLSHVLQKNAAAPALS